MGHDRLSDLAAMTVERDGTFNFEEALDVFAKRNKNTRILLY